MLPVMLEIPSEIAPEAGEAAVVSMLAVRRSPSWAVASGSMLTVPVGVALTSWKRWSELQPEHAGGRDADGFDLGPIFCAEPFPNVRIVRTVIQAKDWPSMVRGLGDSKIDVPSCPSMITISESSSTVLLGRDGANDAHHVVAGAKRPVEGIAATLDVPPVPATSGIWTLASPPHLKPGRDLGAMSRHRNMANWAEPLVGIEWPAGKIPPPACFVVGKIQSRAWIARIKPDPDDHESLLVQIAWDETLIDPLGCSILGRSELDGLPLLVRHLPISDFPGTLSGTEARSMSWRQRTLAVRLPHGPRRAAWGFTLLGPEGELLDECVVAPRIEKVSVVVHAMGSEDSVTSAATHQVPPAPQSRDEEVRATIHAEAEARRAAAHRRISTAGELEEYLRWRFACREGELLLLDPGLFRQHGRRAEVVRFLADFNRPVRVLTRGVPEEAQEALAVTPGIVAKKLPGGGKALHDRVWIVGETAILLGASPGDFLAPPAGETHRATTATDLPHADAVIWRERFEQWWS
jgi:hypothetical protein